MREATPETHDYDKRLFRTEGQLWKLSERGWMSRISEGVRGWEFVEVNESGRVIGLNLKDSLGHPDRGGLHKMPKALKGLTELETLDLRDNGKALDKCVEGGLQRLRDAGLVGPKCCLCFPNCQAHYTTKERCQQFLQTACT